MPSHSRARATKWYLRSAAAILLITGVAKIVSVFGVARVLGARAPLVGLTVGHLMLLAGVAEVFAALLCIHPKTMNAGLLGVAALATSFLVYRLGLWFIGWPGLCGCMGNLASALNLTNEAAERVMKAVLAYLLVGSYAALGWRRWQK